LLEELTILQGQLATISSYIGIHEHSSEDTKEEPATSKMDISAPNVFKAMHAEQHFVGAIVSDLVPWLRPLQVV
jgi:hypothetical protein